MAFHLHRRLPLPLLTGVAGLALGCAAVRSEPALTPATFLAAYDSAAGVARWPGFDPGTIPIAAWTGRETWLFRHPSPPGDFAERDGALVRAGRHPAVTANSSADLSGTRTATVMLERAGSPRQAAAVAIHEAFHVHQRARHPGWTANEVVLFTYPVADTTALALRRLETEAIRRALAGTEAEARCWVVAALEARRERHARVGPDAAGYERASELHEGLARYLQLRASGAPLRLSAEEFPPAAVRDRAYATGAALGLLLDRIDRDWKARLASEEGATLEGLLGEALRDTPACAFAADERERAQARARTDVRGVTEERARLRSAFLGDTGWALVVESAGLPLQTAGFDPLNVTQLEPGEVLHRRYLKLARGDDVIELLDRPALTRSAGEHPLFSGVRSVTVTGLPARPTPRDSSGVLLVGGEGLSARLPGGVATDEGRVVTIRLP